MVDAYASTSVTSDTSSVTASNRDYFSRIPCTLNKILTTTNCRRILPPRPSRNPQRVIVFYSLSLSNEAKDPLLRIGGQGPLQADTNRETKWFDLR
ncbi:hypothetical protein AVEN_62516-1 [Araneus ventricosus]|uniref:Uncharacterized protein n=1 Tax=Araneus ventricosus TaxID=182803 RepID=A0A4Y2VFT5_ARAVE|nr:hypothetical protein AVEN_62516-1 [Araneus ventricosus]